MKNCGFDCTICLGVYCEKMTEPCSCCGEMFPAGDLWMIKGKYLCSTCYMDGFKEERSGYYGTSNCNHG